MSGAVGQNKMLLHGYLLSYEQGLMVLKQWAAIDGVVVYGASLATQDLKSQLRSY